MVKRPGATHYTDRLGRGVLADRGPAAVARSPDEAIFYTSGRASNEAAFAYQLFVRAFGTNNLPDCSNMCHESTSIALQESIGIGKASVSIDDVHHAKLLILAGQNPGTNHPRMLSALETAKRNGAKIISINPLREAGLVRFKNPQTPRGLVGPGTALSDLHLPIRINGDLALFQAVGSLLAELGRRRPRLHRRYTTGFDAWKDPRRRRGLGLVVADHRAVPRADHRDGAMIRDSDATVWCWAMGLTQHRNAVATIKEVVNLALVAGQHRQAGRRRVPGPRPLQRPGRPDDGDLGAAAGHFLDALQQEFGFDPPARERAGHRGLASGRCGTARRTSSSDSVATSSRPSRTPTSSSKRCTGPAMTVHISTKLNRSHLVCGDTALILPTKGRTEKDIQAVGPQWISVEDSTCVVHASRGPLEPASAAAQVRGGDHHPDRARPPSAIGTGCGGRRCGTTTASSARTSPGSSRAARATRSTCTRPAAS